MIHTSAKYKAIIFPLTAAIANMFPTAKAIDLGQGPMGVLPHTEEITHFLRSEQIAAPAPISAYYDWEGGTPYDVQKKTADLLTMNKRAYVLNGLGTGKTKASLWAWRYLNRNKQAGKLLVVSPLSTLSFVWGREIFNTLPGIKSIVLHGSREKRLKLLADPQYDVYIINHHGLSIIKDELAKRTDIDTMIIDELAVYRNGGAAMTKIARKVSLPMKWLWGLTGQPTPNGPTDAWAIATVVTPKTTPKYFREWRDDVMLHVNAFRYVPKANSLEKVHNLLQPAVRFSLDDVLELPEVIMRRLDVGMGPKQQKVYEGIEKEAYAMMDTGELTAMNAGAVLSKLLQISAGYVYMRDGTTVVLDGDERMDTVVDLIMGADHKVLVFAPYKHVLAGIKARLDKEGIENASVSGDTPAGERSQIFGDFQNTSKYTVLEAHPNCLAHGLTLTAADTVIWFGPINAFDIFDQANARIRRIGQKHKQQIIMVQATKAERKAYNNLMAKNNMNNTLLDMFQESTGKILTL